MLEVMSKCQNPVIGVEVMVHIFLKMQIAN